jgi:hypothetical protein
VVSPAIEAMWGGIPIHPPAATRHAPDLVWFRRRDPPPLQSPVTSHWLWLFPAFFLLPPILTLSSFLHLFHTCILRILFPGARQLELPVFGLCARRVFPSRLRHAVHAVKRTASSQASTCGGQSSRAEEGRRMKVLCVAEKPSIAKSITEILSGGHWQTVSRDATLVRQRADGAPSSCFRFIHSVHCGRVHSPDDTTLYSLGNMTHTCSHNGSCLLTAQLPASLHPQL